MFHQSTVCCGNKCTHYYNNLSKLKHIAQNKIFGSTKFEEIETLVWLLQAKDYILSFKFLLRWFDYEFLRSQNIEIPHFYSLKSWNLTQSEFFAFWFFLKNNKKEFNGEKNVHVKRTSSIFLAMKKTEFCHKNFKMAINGSQHRVVNMIDHIIASSQW